MKVPLADAEVRVTLALPPITWEEIEAERESQEEIRQDWVDRQRELQQAAYASFMQWW